MKHLVEEDKVRSSKKAASFAAQSRRSAVQEDAETQRQGVAAIPEDGDHDDDGDDGDGGEDWNTA